MDSLTRREQPDRSKINIHQPHEVKHWTHALNVSKDELQKTIDKVGNSAAAVRKRTRDDRQGARWIGTVRSHSALAGCARSQEWAMPKEQQIRERARRLWREAGEPDGRNEEFWRRAEQELKREDLAAPPNLPDATGQNRLASPLSDQKAGRP